MSAAAILAICEVYVQAVERGMVTRAPGPEHRLRIMDGDTMSSSLDEIAKHEIFSASTPFSRML